MCPQLYCETQQGWCAAPHLLINTLINLEMKFILKIYTKHPEENILIHNKNDLELIYEVLNFQTNGTSRNLIKEILKNRSVKRTVQYKKINECDNSCKKELLQGKDYTTSKS